METTYLLHHCESQALEGLINSLPLLAVSPTIDPPLQQMAKQLYDSGKAIWDNYQAEKVRSNLGLRSASENFIRQDNLFGKSQVLSECLSLDPEILRPNSSPASGIVTLRSSHWGKMIWNGQEFHAFAYLRSGYHAVVQLDNNKSIHRVARICHITQTTNRAETETIQMSNVVLICQLYKAKEDTLKDMWAELHLGFLVHNIVEVGYYHIFPDNIVSSVVLTPTTIGTHDLLVAVPHNKVRHDLPCFITDNNVRHHFSICHPSSLTTAFSRTTSRVSNRWLTTMSHRPSDEK